MGLRVSLKNNGVESVKYDTLVALRGHEHFSCECHVVPRVVISPWISHRLHGGAITHANDECICGDMLDVLQVATVCFF